MSICSKYRETAIWQTFLHGKGTTSSLNHGCIAPSRSMEAAGESDDGRQSRTAHFSTPYWSRFLKRTVSWRGMENSRPNLPKFLPRESARLP